MAQPRFKGIPLRALGSALTLYVDYTNGTDAAGKGFASGASAFKTLQYAIDFLPKYLYADVTINVADEVVSISSAIQIYGFCGDGTLTIKGNPSATPNNGNYEYNAGSNNINNFEILNNSATIVIQGICVDKSSALLYGIYIENSCVYITNVRSRVQVYGVYYLDSRGKVENCVIESCTTAVRVRCSHVICNGISGTGNTNAFIADVGTIYDQSNTVSGTNSSASGQIL